MKKHLKNVISILFSTFFILCILGQGSIFASSFSLEFSGILEHKVLDGSSNNKYYSFYANKPLRISGTADIIWNSNTGKKGNVTYATCYYGSASGAGTAICETSFVVGCNDSGKQFSMSGTTKKAGAKYYLYFYKIEDDNIDLSLHGKLVSSN